MESWARPLLIAVIAAEAVGFLVLAAGVWTLWHWVGRVRGVRRAMIQWSRPGHRRVIQVNHLLGWVARQPLVGLLFRNWRTRLMWSVVAFVAKRVSSGRRIRPL